VKGSSGDGLLSDPESVLIGLRHGDVGVDLTAERRALLASQFAWFAF